MDRRSFIGGGVALLGGCASTARVAGDDDAAFAAIRATLGPGARLGVAALDMRGGERMGFDADARYAMASTFKAPLAAAVLARTDRGLLSLDAPVAFGSADLLEYAPIVRAALAAGQGVIATSPCIGHAACAEVTGPRRQAGGGLSETPRGKAC